MLLTDVRVGSIAVKNVKWAKDHAHNSAHWSREAANGRCDSSFVVGKPRGRHFGSAVLDKGLRQSDQTLSYHQHIKITC